MSVIIMCYVVAGLSFGMYHIFMLCNTNPRIMDIIVDDILKQAEENGESYIPSARSVELMMMIAISLMWVVAWPLLAVKRML